MDIQEGCQLGYSQLKDRAAVEARSILKKYDLSVFPPYFKEGVELALFRGYPRSLQPRQGRLQPASRFRTIFTLKDLKSKKFKRYASFALDEHNKKWKERWVVREVICFSYCPSLRGVEYFVYFGASENSGADLHPFYANIFRYSSRAGDSRSDVVLSVKLLGYEVDQLGSSYDKGEQPHDSIVRKTRKRTYRKQEDSIVRKTRKMTYVKQEDSDDIISYRNTEEDKIGSPNEKDKQVD